MLRKIFTSGKLLSGNVPTNNLILDSRDDHPWAHPYLSDNNIARFCKYSESVWQFACEHVAKSRPRKLRCAFSVNMAQNMYKWSILAKKFGAEATLFLHAMDNFPVSIPQWESFDDEYQELNDGEDFIEKTKNIVPEVTCITVPIQSSEFLLACSAFAARNQTGANPQALLKLLADNEQVRYEVFEAYPQFMSYFDWTIALADFDVIYATSVPFAAYASGRPYCVFSVGGDLQFDCGRGDSFGRAMTLSFNGGRFLMISNPHTLGHSRRLGLTNGVYLPYPMDTDRYCPGEGKARTRWVAEYGDGLFILTTTRLDSGVKGHTDALFKILVEVARARPITRFVFLAWGNSAAEFAERIQAEGMQKQLIVLPPVGKKRLIDYYRSCDIVLDQFVYGYYGATALEAAAIGKPVVMKIRAEHYAPLYTNDVAPVINVSVPEEIREALLTLVDDVALRGMKGSEMRDWVVRTHGEEKTVPLMLALLQLAANRIPLPGDLVNPLCDPLSEAEIAYHTSCLIPAPAPK